MKPILLLLFLTPIYVFSQDIIGLWTGFIRTTEKTLPYELAISENNGRLTGYSHTTFTVDGVDEIGVKAITVQNNSGNVQVEDDEMVFNDYTRPLIKGVRQFDYLTLSIKDSVMLLKGTFKTNKVRNYKSVTGTIELRKIDTSQRTKIIPKLNELNLLNTLSFLQPAQKKQETDIASARLEKVQGNISGNKETAIATSSAVIKSVPVLKSKQTEILATAQTEKEKSLTNLQLQQKDTALLAKVISPEREKKSISELKQKDSIQTAVIDRDKKQTALQPKQQEPTKVISTESEKKAQGISEVKQRDSIQTAFVDRDKKQTVLQSKQQQTTKVISAESEKKPENIQLKRREILTASSDKTKPQIIAPPKQTQTQNVTPTASIKSSSSQEKQVVATTSKALAPKKDNDSSSLIKNVFSATLLPVVKPEIVQVNSAAEVSKRKTEKIQDVFFKTDSLVLNLYDNGEVDGDTVSVVLNGKVIIASQGLTTNAITKTVYITPDLGDSLQLVMYAENLGAIPPNTGLLILQDGKDRYEIRFAGDYQKNSAIILRRKR
jgi:hypothetical protein